MLGKIEEIKNLPAIFMTMRGYNLSSILRRFLHACAVSALVSAPTLMAETDIRRDATVDAIKAVMPCVVNVATESIGVVEPRDPFEASFRQFYGTYQLQSRQSLGSGVIIDEDGYLLTNAHVVKHANRVQVKLSDEAGGGVYDVQPIFPVTPRADVALLKIIPKKKGEKFKAIKLAKDDDLLLGETVIALENPFGLGGSVSRGILSSKQRAAPKGNEDLGQDNWLQTDASINPGNSGGPLINLQGDLIGVNVAILQGAQGIGFAIPIKDVRQAVAELFSPETASRWLGAQIRPGEMPLVIDFIETNSPAHHAGFHIGDTILQVNGKAPKDFLEYNRWLRDETNLNFNFTVKRRTERLEIKVREMPFSELLKKRFGADLVEMTADMAGHLGLSLDSGLLVSKVEKDGPADKTGLKEYFVLAGIDGQRIGNFLDAKHQVSHKAKGEQVQLVVLIPLMQGNILSYQQRMTTLTLR